MGPRRWSRGRGQLTSLLNQWPARLQWGHGDGAVEESRVVLHALPSKRLQWGHGDGAVEEQTWEEATDWNGSLQWGHGDGAVEECI